MRIYYRDLLWQTAATEDELGADLLTLLGNTWQRALTKQLSSILCLLTKFARLAFVNKAMLRPVNCMRKRTLG